MYALNARSRDEVFRMPGVVLGHVTDNKNADGMYMVKVKYPGLSNVDEETSDWVRICTLGAGPDRGWFNLPEVGDEVCLAFVGGDYQHPIVLGTLWSKERAPQRNNIGTKDGAQDSAAGANNGRGFKSRAGHTLTFNDDKKAGAVIIKTQHGHRVELSDKDGSLQCVIMTGDGKQKITFDETNNQIVMESAGNIVIKAKDDARIEAKTIHLACSNAFVNTDTLDVKAKQKIGIKSDGSSELASTAVTTIKGSLVKLNP